MPVPAQQRPNFVLLPALERQPLLRRRACAAAIDVAVTQGFSLYCAKILTLVFLLGLAPELERIPNEWGDFLFAGAFQYGFLAVWAGTSFVLWFLYQSISISSFGASLGGALWGLRVRTEGGSLPSFSNSCVRAVFTAFNMSLLGLPLLPALWSGREQMWHDEATATAVSEATSIR